MSKESEYKKIYLQEADELLQQMNRSLLVFEKDPLNKDALNAIFRSAHTLKSMSASMGYRPVSDLSHKMEDVLDQLRGGVIKADEKITELLFRSFDSLEKMAEDVRNGRPPSADIGGIMSALDSTMQKKSQVSEEKISSGISLNEFDKRTLARVKKEGFFPYQIIVTLDKNCVLKSVRAFMVFRNLHTIGEVIKSFPDSQTIEEERFENQFGCIFITKENPETVKSNAMEVLEVKDVEVEIIPVDESWDSIVYSEAAETVSKDGAPALAEHIKKLQSVRVDVTLLDKLMNLVEELAICRLRFTDLGAGSADGSLRAGVEQLGRLTDELQNEVMKARLVPVGQIFERFPRLVRDLAKKENKMVRMDVVGADIELDRTILDEIGEPLIHLLRNSIDHGIESPEERKKQGKAEEGRVLLSARKEKSYVFIEVEDDGKGIDAEVVRKAAVSRGIISEEAARAMSEQELLFLTTRPGFSTKKDVTDVSGRGVGLDVVREKTEVLGGSLLMGSKAGKGTKITMRLPVTTAVIKALLVKLLNRVFAIPVSGVIEIIIVKEKDIKKVENQETILHRNKVLPIVRIGDRFGVRDSSFVTRDSSFVARDSSFVTRDSSFVARDSSFVTRDSNDERRTTNDERLNIVIVESGASQFGIVVDGLLSQQDVVVKQLTKELRGVKGFAGATILGDGSVALVLDVATLV